MSHFFISYRRSDQEGKYLAHMIFRELRSRYGEPNVFLDVDSRSPGLSFQVKVDRVLDQTDVVLVIIGPAWLNVLNERRGDSRDWVRYEVAESLKREGLPVVPICLPGVDIPQSHQLPEELKDLGSRDGIILDPFQDFDSHLNRLLNDLEQVLRPEGVSGGLRGEGVPSPPAQRHEKIAQLLARLRQEALRLAEGFADRSTQQRFLGEFDAPMRPRLDRLRTYSEQGEMQLREHWLGQDLVATLDALARFYSEAVTEGRQGHAAAKGLARKLRAWLYDRFSPACQAEGWFSIDPIEPYRTAFDPNVHRAITGRDVDGAAGKIIAIKAIGRRHPKSGAVIHRAEVIVGR